MAKPSIGASSVMDRLRKNRPLQTFLVCFLVSSFFWLVTKLDQQYTYTLNLEVDYASFPKDKLLERPPAKKLDVKLRASGEKLFRYELFGHRDLFVDVRKVLVNRNGAYFWNPGRNRILLGKQMSSEISIEEIKPDTIFFELSNRVYKKVPIKLNAEVGFDPGFSNIGAWQLQPDSVMISGTEEAIKSISQVSTEEVNLQGVQETVNIPVDLIRPDFNLLDLDPYEVNLKMEVRAYTEAEFSIPLEVRNASGTAKLSLFPSMVNLHCKVPKENWSELNSADFKLFVDASEVSDSTAFLNIYHEEMPEQVKNVRIYPDQVEFIARHSK